MKEPQTQTAMDQQIFKGRAGENRRASESLVWWRTAGVAFSIFTSRWPWWWRSSPWCWTSGQHGGPQSCFVLLLCVHQARFRVDFYLYLNLSASGRVTIESVWKAETKHTRSFYLSLFFWGVFSPLIITFFWHIVSHLFRLIIRASCMYYRISQKFICVECEVC